MWSKVSCLQKQYTGNAPIYSCTPGWERDNVEQSFLSRKQHGSQPVIEPLAIRWKVQCA